MGLVYGQYDAKPQGFVPGGFSLHNSMLPHGPDTEAFAKASAAKLQPHKLEGTLAFMFESRHAQRVTSFAAAAPQLQTGYQDCWGRLAQAFRPGQAMTLDHTHDPALRSWVQDATGHPDFPIQNLPLGVFSPNGQTPRGSIAIGNHILDLRAAEALGLFFGEQTQGPLLNEFLSLGTTARRELRHAVSALLQGRCRSAPRIAVRRPPTAP